MTLIVFILSIAIIIILVYGLYKYKNRRIKPDYYETFKIQDTVPVGKVGVFVSAHIQGGTIEPYYWYNMSEKLFNNVIPWPFRIFARADNGVALLDPVKFYEYEEFVPTKPVGWVKPTENML
jgi:hypothetical protein